MGVLISMRPDVKVGELPVKKVDELAHRIYSLGYLDGLNRANGGAHADRILASKAGGTQDAAY